MQEQTFKRALEDLDTFCVCGENDYIRFQANALKKPVIVVLKKNVHVLKQWKNNFASTNFCAGNPLFIVDDEADAEKFVGIEYIKDGCAHLGANAILSVSMAVARAAPATPISGAPKWPKIST